MKRGRMSLRNRSELRRPARMDDAILVSDSDEETTNESKSENTYDSSPAAPVENKRARTTLNIAQSCIEGVPTTEVTVNLASSDRTTVILHADEQSTETQIEVSCAQEEVTTDHDQTTSSVSDQQTASTSTNVTSCQPSTSTGISDNKADDDFDDTLTCVICQEIMHDCVGLQPCMHSFCAGCYSEWMTTSKECPTCRKNVERVNKNHLVNNLIESYLSRYPEKKRSQDDLEELDRKNKVTKNTLYSASASAALTSPPVQPVAPRPNVVTVYPSYFTASDVAKLNAGYSYRDLKRGVTHDSYGCCRSRSPSPPRVTYQCTQCPHYGGPRSAGYRCVDNQLHITCSCCNNKMPDRTIDRMTDPSIPGQKCEGCRRILCGAYKQCDKVWGGRCNGCLFKFKEVKVSWEHLEGILLDNRAESLRLHEYLRRNGKTPQHMFDSCTEDHLAGNSKNFTADSYVCERCALSVFKEMAYAYRLTIKSEDINVQNFPDCYWGKNCRTQKHNFQHASKYNHICDQTKFAKKT